MMKNAFFSRYGFHILVVVFFLLPFIGQGTNWTIKSNSNNVADWLPDSFEETHQYQWFLQHFPFERFVVVSWQGCTMDDSRLEMFAQKLVPGQTIDNIGRWAEEHFRAELVLEEETSAVEILAIETPPAQRNVNEPVEEPFPNITGTTPALPAPKNVKASSIGGRGDLTVQWAHVENAAGYKIEYIKSATPPVSWDGATECMATAEQFTKCAVEFNNLDSGNYFVRVLAVGDAINLSNSAWSTPVGVRVLHYFKTVLTGPRLFRILRDLYDGEGIGSIRLSDEAIHRKLQGILIGPDGESTALIVTLTTEAPQGKDLALVLEAIREIGRECGVHPQIQADDRFVLAKISDAVITTIGEMIYGRSPSLDGVILGGPPVDNVAITQEGEQTLQRLIGLCGIIGLTLAWLCFRDFRLTLFVFWVAIISAGVALASVSFTGSTCDAILLSMPALVYVLAMSGAIHMINYYHDAVREHGLDMAPERAVRYAWYPCFCANLTTAFGLISLCMSGLIPISKFGFYSALGIMLQLVLLFLYLPTLLHFYPSHKVAAQETLNIKENSPMQRMWRVWGNFIVRHAAAVSIVCLVVMIFFGLGLFQVKTSVKMMRFFSSDSEIIHHYTWLEEHLGPLVPMEVVIRFDNEALMSENDRSKMRTLDRLRLIESVCNALRSELDENIGGVMSAETFMPPTPPPGRGTNAIVRERIFNAFLDQARSELRDYVTIEGNLSFRPGSERRNNLALIGISAEEADRLISAGVDDARKLLNTPADAELVGISYEELKELRDKAKQWERNYGIDLWRVSLRVWSLKKDIDYAHFIQDVKNVVDPIIAEANEGLVLESPGIQAIYTGMVPVVYKTQHELYWGLVYSFILSFFMIGIAMSVVLRSALKGFLVMIPNLFPVFVVFGFMGQFGILVDIGTMMTASVALGIATDDTIHFLTWFRQGIDHGMNRADATRYAYSRSATAIVQTTLIAGFGLAAFALSTFTPTQMFGVMMLAILMMATFGNLVFLAAMLNTPIGWFFEKKKSKE